LERVGKITKKCDTNFEGSFPEGLIKILTKRRVVPRTRLVEQGEKREK